MDSETRSGTSPAPDERRQYQPPEIVEYGSAAKVTSTIGAGAIDDGEGDPFYSS
jgi:hypothetical protein